MAYHHTDLTDSQWEVIEKTLDEKRRRQHSLRQVCNLLLYLLRTGCQWRQLPERGVGWSVVYYYFRKWQGNGIIEQLHELLYTQVRKSRNRPETPSAAVIDSQSVKTALAQQSVGYDAGKKVKGRKRHLLVDTQGLVISVAVTSASMTDRKGACELLRRADPLKRARLRRIYADQGYSGKLKEWTKKKLGIELEVVKKLQRGMFRVLPKRWIVERNFAWLGNFRRLSKDYERLTQVSESFILLAMCQLMLNILHH